MQDEWLVPGVYELPPGHWLVIVHPDKGFVVWWKTRHLKTLTGALVDMIHRVTVGAAKYNTDPKQVTAVLRINGGPWSNAVIVPKKG